MNDDGKPELKDALGGLFILIAIAVGLYYVGKWSASSDCLDRAYSDNVKKEYAIQLCKGTK